MGFARVFFFFFFIIILAQNIGTDANNNVGTCSPLQEAIHEVLLEEREIESRRLNIVVHALPEASVGISGVYKDAILKIVNDKLVCGVEIENCQRLGKIFPDRINVRPVRFTVNHFDSKRKILEASRRLKNDKELSCVFYPRLAKELA